VHMLQTLRTPLLRTMAHLRTYVSHRERGVSHVWITNEVCSRCHVPTIIARVIVVFSMGLQMAAERKRNPRNTKTIPNAK
jgi:hypothetical protein